MARKKLPPDCFEHYFALGPGRSYEQVAEHYGVSKTTVANLAEREDWQGQVAKREETVRRRSEEKTMESLDDMRERHLKLLRLMQAKAIESLKSMSLDRAIDAVRTLDLTIRQERVVRGEPGDRTAVTVEDTIRREYERWMTVGPRRRWRAPAGGPIVTSPIPLSGGDHAS